MSTERCFTIDTLQHINEEVTIFGWVRARRNLGKLIFADIRDRWGVIQVVFSPDRVDAHAKAVEMRPEWVVKITGIVKERPAKLVNPEQALGRIEMEATAIEILNKAETLPFAVDTDGYELGEELRMKFRYLDLRRERMRRNLVMRYGIIQMMRRFLGRNGFIEVETPILTKSTPEGARDYVVPSRVHPGTFYALPQSPQQYKQLLMVGGIDRYFQIARCFRDEDTRGERQPEFTQLDIEMSFITEDDILRLVEDMFMDIVRHVDQKRHIHAVPFPHITYKEAMERWKTDSPDLREKSDDPDELAFAFITDFPLFEWRENEKRWDATHHPFTSPKLLPGETTQAFIARMKEDPGSVVSQQYDLVCNGHELGGGSIRIHDPEMQSAIFEHMGHTKEAVRAKFGHMLEAFTYGVPPHGGIAFGMERLLKILYNEPSIREMIAFPKTGDARDLMMNAPSEVDEQQLKELHLKIEK